jgi:RND superfamily putative drug exporter
MAVLLYRVGGWAFRHRRLVAGFWLVVLVALGIGATTLKGKTSDVFSVPGTEGQRALDLLNEKFAGTGGATARIVFAAPAGHTLSEPRYRRLVAPTVALARKVPQTVAPASSLQKSLTVSKDSRVVFADLNFAVPLPEVTDATKRALERVAVPARSAGLQVEFSGGLISTGGGAQSKTEIVGIVIALIVLLVTFGALLPSLLPLLTAFIGVGISTLAIQALSGFMTLSSTAPALATMLGLAVGIDYALFIASRHRQNLAQALAPEEAAARAVATAGSAVVFAGVTVFIALAALTVVGLPFLSVMGLAAAGAVLVQVALALTLLPALIGFAGKRAGKGKQFDGSRDNLGARWARAVTRRPWFAVVGVAAVLVVVALPVLHMNLGLPDAETQSQTTTERRAYDLLSKGFGAGFNGPLTVVVDSTGQKNPKLIATRAADGLGQFPDVAAASAPALNKTAEVAIISVTPKSGPSTQATKDLVSQIRDRAASVREQYGIDVLVTGATAINIDVSNKLSSALPVMLLLIVGLALGLLMLVFRSLVVPVKAVIGFLLTIASALGLLVWVFQDGHLGSLIGLDTTSPIVSFLPVIMLALLFGLAMDYEVFLVSRIRESYVHEGGATASIIAGFRGSARVVTAAAIIMMSVFGGFIFGGEPVIKAIGLGLAFGVFADAFLVRMTLVPAVLTLLGESAWKLPAWLDRVLPNVDIEGDSLSKHLRTNDARPHAHRVPQAPPLDLARGLPERD